MERYQIQCLIGEGSFGKVFKARVMYTGQLVAMKFMSKHGKTEKDIRNLRREIEIQKTLSHRNVISLLDSMETPTEFVIVMEYAQGELYDVLSDEGKLPEPLVASIARDLTAALHYLHSRHIIHRDLKPQNILIGAHGVLKLCDFGFARAIACSTAVLNSIKGTPLYMAPEVVQELPYSYSADLWSLGVILYELHQGTPPFYTNNLYALIHQIVQNPVVFPKDVSTEFLSLLRGLLSKNPSERLNWTQLESHPFITSAVPLGDDELSAEPFSWKIPKKIMSQIKHESDDEENREIDAVSQTPSTINDQKQKRRIERNRTARARQKAKNTLSDPIETANKRTRKAKAANPTNETEIGTTIATTNPNANFNPSKIPIKRERGKEERVLRWEDVYSALANPRNIVKVAKDNALNDSLLRELAHNCPSGVCVLKVAKHIFSVSSRHAKTALPLLSRIISRELSKSPEEKRDEVIICALSCVFEIVSFKEFSLHCNSNTLTNTNSECKCVLPISSENEEAPPTEWVDVLIENTRMIDKDGRVDDIICIFSSIFAHIARFPLCVCSTLILESIMKHSFIDEIFDLISSTTVSFSVRMDCFVVLNSLLVSECSLVPFPAHRNDQTVCVPARSLSLYERLITQTSKCFSEHIHTITPINTLCEDLQTLLEGSEYCDLVPQFLQVFYCLSRFGNANAIDCLHRFSPVLFTFIGTSIAATNSDVSANHIGDLGAKIGESELTQSEQIYGLSLLCLSECVRQDRTVALECINQPGGNVVFMEIIQHFLSPHQTKSALSSAALGLFASFCAADKESNFKTTLLSEDSLIHQVFVQILFVYDTPPLLALNGLAIFERYTFCHAQSGLHDPPTHALAQISQFPRSLNNTPRKRTSSESDRSEFNRINSSDREEIETDRILAQSTNPFLGEFNELTPLWLRLSSLLETTTEVNQLSPNGVNTLLFYLTSLLKTHKEKAVLLFRTHGLITIVCELVHECHLKALSLWPDWANDGPHVLAFLTNVVNFVIELMNSTESETQKELLKIFEQNEFALRALDALKYLPIPKTEFIIEILAKFCGTSETFCHQVCFGSINDITTESKTRIPLSDILPLLQPNAPSTILCASLSLLVTISKVSAKYCNRLSSLDIVTLLSALLNHSDNSVQMKTVNLIGELCRHSDFHLAEMERHEIGTSLAGMLTNSDDSLRRFLCYSIGNLAFHSTTLHAQLREAVPTLCSLAKANNSLNSHPGKSSDDERTLCNAVCALGNLMRHSNDYSPQNSDTILLRLSELIHQTNSFSVFRSAIYAISMLSKHTIGKHQKEYSEIVKFCRTISDSELDHNLVKSICSDKAIQANITRIDENTNSLVTKKNSLL